MPVSITRVRWMALLLQWQFASMIVTGMRDQRTFRSCPGEQWQSHLNHHWYQIAMTISVK
jgi:hypothetical protein